MAWKRWNAAGKVNHKKKVSKDLLKKQEIF